ncbi:MAG: hypothetical protein HY301_13935 [Verrucomicrobia bacterium]|nr:hypothetical protein [Verrucomicrobiota bacterium]
MKILRQLVLLLALVATTAAVLLWQRSERFAKEAASLRAQLAFAKELSAVEAAAKAKQAEAELQRLRAEAEEVHKLRGEVSQLRAGAKETEKLRTENQRLRTESQQARAAAAMAATPAPAPASTDFPKESWSFAGYQTPEAAFVSAIWAMQQANAKTYLESLTPEEQARMLQRWEGKTEAEIAAKLQGDVARITGLQVVDRQQVAPDEVRVSVVIGGTDRTENVGMKLINNEWKFGGFIRPAK